VILNYYKRHKGTQESRNNSALKSLKGLEQVAGLKVNAQALRNLGYGAETARVAMLLSRG
jgi:hypothetical protein